MVKQNTNTEQHLAERNSSQYRGVRKRKWGKWVSEIRLPNSRERIWLGSYDSAEKAALAFDAAMFCLRGRSAKFNFPDNPPDIAGGESLTPSQIQAAAARFANSETPKSKTGQPMNIELPMESQSSISEGTVQTDGNATQNGSSSNLFTANGSSNCPSDYAIFPGLDEFSNDYYIPELPAADYGQENFDELIIQDPFLWNFEEP